MRMREEWSIYLSSTYNYLNNYMHDSDCLTFIQRKIQLRTVKVLLAATVMLLVAAALIRLARIPLGLRQWCER